MMNSYREEIEPYPVWNWWFSISKTETEWAELFPLSSISASVVYISQTYITPNPLETICVFQRIEGASQHEGHVLRLLTAHVFHRLWSTQVFHSPEGWILTPRCIPAPQPTLTLLSSSAAKSTTSGSNQSLLCAPESNRCTVLWKYHLNFAPRATKEHGKARQPWMIIAELCRTPRCLSGHMLESCRFRLRDVLGEPENMSWWSKLIWESQTRDSEPKNSSIWKCSVLSGRSKLRNISRHLPDICKVEYVNAGTGCSLTSRRCSEAENILLS